MSQPQQEKRNKLGGWPGNWNKEESGRPGDHPLYDTWYGMLRRCYDERDDEHRRYGARGVVVFEEWKAFATFVEWGDSQKRKDDWQLDKDILGDGESYSPESCVFVPQSINQLFRRELPRELPRGVTQVGRKFAASFTWNGPLGKGQTRQTGFETPEDAQRHYSKIKGEYLTKLLDLYDGQIETRLTAHLQNLIINQQLT